MSATATLTSSGSYAQYWEEDERAPYKSLPQLKKMPANPGHSSDTDEDGVIKYITQYLKEERDLLCRHSPRIPGTRASTQSYRHVTFDELYPIDPIYSGDESDYYDEDVTETERDSDLDSDAPATTPATSPTTSDNTSPTVIMEPEQDPLFIMAGAAKFAYT